MSRKNKAQAATELAVLGSLIIVVFSYLMLYGQKLNRQQAYLMKTFRAALEEVKGEGSVSYIKVAHRRIANINTPYALSQPELYSSSAYVLWGIGDKNSEIVEVDGTKRTVSEEGETKTQIKTTTTTSSDTLELQSFTKTQSPGGPISTTRTQEAWDVAYEGAYEVTSYLGDGGKYYSDSSSKLTRGRTWTTPED